MESNATKSGQVFQYLSELIQSGNLKAGDKLPTEKELCLLFNVSRVTVQAAYNKLQKMGKIYRIRGGGSYVGQPQAGISPSNQNHIIPFILNDIIPEARHLELIEGANDFFRNTYHVSVYPINQNPEKEKAVFDNLIKAGLRSFVVLPLNRSRDLYFDLMQKGYHLVFLNHLPNPLNGNLVCCDNFMGGYLITSHLLKQGYRHIAAITHPASYDTTISKRINGFYYAHHSFGLTPDPAYIKEMADGINLPLPQVLRTILQELVSCPVPPDAIFCINDSTAIEVYRVLDSMGLKVPEDIALTGFDNLQMTRQNPVPITTVDQPFYAMGYQAAKLCYELENAEHTNATQTFTFPVSLIQRESTSLKRKY